MSNGVEELFLLLSNVVILLGGLLWAFLVSKALGRVRGDN